MLIETVSASRIRFFLFAILLAVYLLVYIPIPDSIDGSDTLDVARTLVLAGSPAATILATPRQLIVTGAAGEQYLISPDGERYTKKGVVPSLLLIPFVILAQILPWLSLRATAMLFNPLVLAFGGVAVYDLLRECGHTRRTALLTALLYGLTTLAITYSRTLFGEPLAGLLLTVALRYAHRLRHNPDGRAALVAGTALGLCCGVNLTYAALIPIFAGYAFGRYISVMLFGYGRSTLRPGSTPSLPVRHIFLLPGNILPDDAKLRLNSRIWRVISLPFLFASPIILSVGFLLWYNLVRYGSLTETGYYLGSVEGFTTPLFYGLYGLWLSPYKGFFWFSPIMLLILPGVVLLYRRSRALLLTVLALIIIQSVIYGTWWAWDGAYCRGPRFLLPVLPLMMVLVAPIIEKAGQRRHLIIGIIALAVISGGIQFLGAFYDYRIFYGQLYRYDLFDPINNLILADLALLWTGRPSDLAWLAEGFDIVHLLVAGGVAIGGVMALYLPKHFSRTLSPGMTDRISVSPPRCAVEREPGGEVYRGLFIIIIFVALNIIVFRQQDNASQEYVSQLTEALQPPGTVLVASFQPGTALMDVETIGRFIVINPHAPQDNPLVQKQIQTALRRGDIVWYMTWRPPTDPANWLERALWEQYALITQTILDNHRLMGFQLRPGPGAETPGGWQFAEMRLESYGLRRAEDGLFVTLDWSTAAPATANYTWFVHLVDATGTIIRQQDRAPAGGYAPVTTWRPGDIVTDRLFFPVESGVDTGGWHLRIGIVNPLDGQPVRVTDATGNGLPDPFILIPVE